VGDIRLITEIVVATDFSRRKVRLYTVIKKKQKQVPLYMITVTTIRSTGKLKYKG
jgi:hypothetical protein